MSLFGKHARLAWLGSLALAMAALAGQPAAAATDIEVRTASIRQLDDAWVLTARIDYRLTRKALEALENGIALTFRVEVSVSRVRNWWTDPEVVERQLNWQLSFEPLSQRYLLIHPEGREPSSHGTLFGALNTLGRLQSLPIADSGALTRGQTYNVAVRAVLDQETLPGPLQVLAFWDSGFSLESDWYEWTMAP